ncbi:MAG: hypothetical protein AAFY16_04800 [Cyanobacteria bacterium J06642_3]
MSCLIGCEQLNEYSSLNSDLLNSSTVVVHDDTNLAEVAPPAIIKNLAQELDQYTPQVKILTPQANQTLSQTNIEIKLEVKELPIFQDDRLGLGNHINLIIDNEPLQEIYSLEEPILIKSLAPGTHVLRAFAVSPWGESFKNEGAYSQITFSVLTETIDNRLQPNTPLLSYNSPTGIIGAEPFLLDYYLTNVSLNKSIEDTQDSKAVSVRATVNGTSFILQNWQPRYLKGLEVGDNWVQLELIDVEGKKIENSFNDTVRVFTYDPEHQDTLAKLVSNKISLANAESIVKQNYYIQPVGTAEIIDLEDNSEPEIIIDETDNLAELELDNQSEEITQVEKPTASNNTTKETEQLSEVETIIDPEQFPAETSETVNIKQNVATQEDVISTSENVVDDFAKLDSATVPVQARSQAAEYKIFDTEVNYDQEEEAAGDIVIPEIKLPESGELEIALKTPQVSTGNELQDSIELEEDQQTSRWWKKLLVKLRQAIETLAKQLPSQA